MACLMVEFCPYSLTPWKNICYLSASCFQVRSMKQIEYIYLALVAVGIVFLATEFNDLSNQTRILAMIGIAIMAFMYSFRRNSRISMEKRWKESEEREEVEEENNSK